MTSPRLPTSRAFPARALDTSRDLIYRFGLIAVFLVLIVYFSSTERAFGTWINAILIVQALAITAIIALGVTISLTVDGFDLSVGATVSLVVMLSAAAQVYWSLGAFWAVVIGLGMGVAVGLVNGLLIVVARVPDLIATLGTMFTFQGLALVITNGQSVAAGATYHGAPATGRFDPVFLWLGRGSLGGIPFSVIVMIVIGALVTVFLAWSRPGRILTAIGGNPEATRLVGLRVGRWKIIAYVLSGLLASIGGILLSARLGRGDVGTGDPYLLQTVAAALIGYSLLGRNRPSGLGTLFGALFVQVLAQGLTMANAPYYVQDFVKGLLVVGAVVLSFSSLFRRKDAS